MSELYDVYQQNEKFAGKEIDGSMLLPLYHSSAQAQIEVTIDGDGAFETGKIVDKKDAYTIIPVTIDSASRSNGIIPHPLCDGLKYVAGDYCRYVQASGKSLEGFHREYMNGLEKWHSSPHTHPKVDAIYQYLKKNCLVEDLVGCGVLIVDDNGNLDSKTKVNNVAQPDMFVRFCVNEFASDKKSQTWLDESLYNSYVDYYNQSVGKKQLCYVTGTMSQATYKHMGKISKAEIGAKLLSSNDTENFTYRGRFNNKEEAYCVSTEVSQKAHLALRWLLDKQGINIDKFSLVTWGTRQKELPKLMEGTDKAFKQDNAFTLDEEKPFTQQAYAEKLNKAIKSYTTNLQTDSKIMVLGIEASTPGRLSVVIFRELNETEYFENIQKWHASCCWMFSEYDKQKEQFYHYFGAPSVHLIATAIYGTEQGKDWMTIDNTLKARVVQRLIPCIIDGKPLPRDLAEQLVNRVSEPQKFNNNSNWKKVMNVACAVLNKQQIDNNKEAYQMSVNKENVDPSYLYGRLLAVMDVAEKVVSNDNNDRQTNAMRYFTRFAQRPFETFTVIYNKLVPYLSKMPAKQKNYYDNKIEEIVQLLGDNYKQTQKLDSAYIFGFYAQENELKGYSKIEKEND